MAIYTSPLGSTLRRGCCACISREGRGMRHALYVPMRYVPYTALVYEVSTGAGPSPDPFSQCVITGLPNSYRVYPAMTSIYRHSRCISTVDRPPLILKGPGPQDPSRRSPGPLFEGFRPARGKNAPYGDRDSGDLQKVSKSGQKGSYIQISGTPPESRDFRYPSRIPVF